MRLALFLSFRFALESRQLLVARVCVEAMGGFRGRTQTKEVKRSSARTACKSSKNWERTTGCVKDNRLSVELESWRDFGKKNFESFYITASPMVSYKWESVKTLQDAQGNMVLLCRRLTDKETCLLVKWMVPPVVQVFARYGKWEFANMAGKVIGDMPQDVEGVLCCCEEVAAEEDPVDRA